MKTVILFGSMGFIGRNIAEKLMKNPQLYLITPTRYECNLLRFRDVNRVIMQHNVDIVINAAYIEVNSGVKRTKKYLNDNLRISNNILKACKNKKGIKRIIYFGSGLEYGDSSRPILEDHTLQPKNYYAETKAIQSKESLALAKKFDLPLVLIRPFNLYGPYDTKSVFYYVIKSILTKKEFSVTKGEQLRDLLYIDDLIGMIEQLINEEKEIKNGEIINAGFGKGVKLHDAISQIVALTSYKELIKSRDYRVNEYFSQVADIAKAKQILSWEPEVSLEEGFNKTIAWIKTQLV